MDEATSMATMLNRSIEVFISYAREDKEMLKRLETHLSLLEHQGLISVWYDLKAPSGTSIAEEVQRHLNTAQIILLIVSSNYLANDVSLKEAEWAVERHRRGEARVIPVILRPTNWRDAPFGQIQVL